MCRPHSSRYHEVKIGAVYEKFVIFIFHFRIFQNYRKECEKGPVVVVQLSGEGALGVGKEMGEAQVLASCNQEQANRDIQSFFNFADMQMNF